MAPRTIAASVSVMDPRFSSRDPPWSGNGMGNPGWVRRPRQAMTHAHGLGCNNAPCVSPFAGVSDMGPMAMGMQITVRCPGATDCLFVAHGGRQPSQRRPANPSRMVPSELPFFGAVQNHSRLCAELYCWIPRRIDIDITPFCASVDLPCPIRESCARASSGWVVQRPVREYVP